MMNKTLLYLFAIFTLCFSYSYSAIAADQAAEQSQEKVAEKEDTSHRYAPDFCDFEVTFPDEPDTKEQCNDKDQCYDRLSFTKVYGITASVNFRFICNPISESVYDDYGEKIMMTTLRSMTLRTVAKELNGTFREDDKFKQAAIVGEGIVGRTPMIYIAQMWIGKNSAMTVEAELIGDEHQDAEKLFTDILRTIHHKK
tara:strand:+ start:311 stop:904 length:594 start_codon:yes stop_codon:yes gene_type:complete